MPKSSLKKQKQNKTKTQKTTTKETKQQQHLIVPVHITGGDAIRQLL